MGRLGKGAGGGGKRREVLGLLTGAIGSLRAAGGRLAVGTAAEGSVVTRRAVLNCGDGGGCGV